MLPLSSGLLLNAVQYKSNSVSRNYASIFTVKISYRYRHIFIVMLLTKKKFISNTNEAVK